MLTTPNLLLTYLAPAQLQPEVPINDAWDKIDAAVTAALADATHATTKGDLVGFDTAIDRVPVGADGKVLTADSTQALGLKWATPAAGTVTSVGLTTSTLSLGGSASPIVGAGSFSVDLTIPELAALTLATTAIQSLQVTTKGDLLGFDSAADRVPVGTNGQVLTADSTQALGLKWAAPSVQKLAASAIPFILAPTGTMANNGAITLGTALPMIYAKAYIHLPANAIVAGSAAGWYYVVMASTTVGQVFNNTYVAGLPAIPGIPTAFVTTGPGAYAGVTTLQTAQSISVPANSMGPNGVIRYSFTMTCPSNANNKTVFASYGAFSPADIIVTTNPAATLTRSFANRGVTNSQISDGGTGLFGPGLSGGVPNAGAIDSTVAQNFVFQPQLAVATDYLVLEKFLIEVIPG